MTYKNYLYLKAAKKTVENEKCDLENIKQTAEDLLNYFDDLKESNSMGLSKIIGNDSSILTFDNVKKKVLLIINKKLDSICNLSSITTIEDYCNKIDSIDDNNKHEIAGMIREIACSYSSLFLDNAAVQAIIKFRGPNNMVGAYLCVNKNILLGMKNTLVLYLESIFENKV